MRFCCLNRMFWLLLCFVRNLLRWQNIIRALHRTRRHKYTWKSGSVCFIYNQNEEIYSCRKRSKTYFVWLCQLLSILFFRVFFVFYPVWLSWFACLFGVICILVSQCSTVWMEDISLRLHLYCVRFVNFLCVRRLFRSKFHLKLNIWGHMALKSNKMCSIAQLLNTFTWYLGTFRMVRNMGGFLYFYC